jgi:release factor glutamine methyltransferase
MTTVAAIATIVAAGAARLRDAGFTPADADLDAGVIARGLLGWSLADWLSRRDNEADAAFTNQFDALIGRRATHEPVAYLLGTREFYGRPFAVQPGVLIPRPETELLVEVALEWVEATEARLIADVGTGSGCVAITLALEHPGLSIIATDRSPEALAIAKANADALGPTSAVEWRETDLLAGVTGPLDLIVSNPPYVPERDRASLSADVRDFEPSLALFAGDDGLDVVRRLIPQAISRLRPGGALIMEVGEGQWPAVTTLLEQSGCVSVDWHVDLQGIPRIVAAGR